MDPRRLLILILAAATLEGCAELSRLHASAHPIAPITAPATLETNPTVVAAPPAIPPARVVYATMAPIPDSPTPRWRRKGHGEASVGRALTATAGRDAIAVANAAARETSEARDFLGGVQVFAYDPGRVFEVWTAPLRVTTLTLSPGETVLSKAAGDTVRWQIGETPSGEGNNRRAHVMIKPLQRGLETNLVIATNRRVYLIDLRSGGADAFNAEVAWDIAAAVEMEPSAPSGPPGGNPVPNRLAAPEHELDARYRIVPKGRRPAWTPTVVMTDGVRTFLWFPPSLAAGEAPALLALSPTGEAQLVNYRQQGSLWVVDQVLQSAELRLGGRKRQVVRLEREGPAS